LCGSRVSVDVTLDATGKIIDLGQEVRACALGQASAALMAAAAIGRTADDLAEAREALRLWLGGERGDPGPWPGLDRLAPAILARARHGAVLLAFEAAAEAAVAAGNAGR